MEDHIPEIKDTGMMFNVFNIQGIIHQTRFQLELSDTLFQKAFFYAGLSGDSANLFKVNNNIALNNRHRGNYEAALKDYQNNLLIARGLGQPYFIATTLSEIGNVFILLENWTKAFEYQKIALSKHKENEDVLRIGNTYNSLVAIYSSEGEFRDLNKALLYADSAISSHEVSGNIYSLANAKRQRCSLLGFFRLPEESLACYEELLEMDSKIQNLQGIMIDYKNIGSCLTNLERYEEATESLLKAVEYSRAINEKRVLAVAYYSLSLSYHNLGDDQRAYAYADSIPPGF